MRIQYCRDIRIDRTLLKLDVLRGSFRQLIYLGFAFFMEETNFHRKTLISDKDLSPPSESILEGDLHATNLSSQADGTQDVEYLTTLFWVTLAVRIVNPSENMINTQPKFFSF